MKLFYATIIGLSLVTFASCKKDNRGLKNPQPLLLKPMHNGAILSDAELNKITLTYHITLTSTHKEPVADFGRAPGTGYQEGLLYSADVAALSAEDDVKQYYLQFADGSIDTLTINYQSISESEARDNPCFCKLPQISIKINNHPASVAGYNTDSIPIYIVPR